MNLTPIEDEPFSRAIIESSRKELELERASHRQTRMSARLRIMELEARVARRDAELEACVVHDHILGSTSEDAHRELTPLTQSGAIQALEATAARNRSLEREVQGLMSRVSASSYMIQLSH